jgi:hypothetical protein
MVVVGVAHFLVATRELGINFSVLRMEVESDVSPKGVRNLPLEVPICVQVMVEVVVVQ